MQVLVVGGGGREHALAWKIAQSPQVKKVWVAPGNAGTALENKVNNIDIASNDITALLEFASKQPIDLTVVGPEVPLSLGLVDRFQTKNLLCFGPTQAAAQLESSKSFCKDFLQRHNIPTARYCCFTDRQAAVAYLERQSFPQVIKADGLAAGKGVIIAQNLQQAQDAVTDMLEKNTFGNAGARVVIEEFLTGEELSFIVMSDGQHVVPLASSQDHKRRDDDDQGPNTGGMGAYSPAPILSQQLHTKIMRNIIHPVLQSIAQEITPYVGFLYAGLMITPDGEPKVLEFNCRLGDPETQPLMMRLQSDLTELLLAGCTKRLHCYTPQWDARVALGVVLAAAGYPAQHRQGDLITGLDQNLPEYCKVFHSGTHAQGNNVVTQGGRVLTVTCLADNFSTARKRAYLHANEIQWPGRFYRHDIGLRALQHHDKVNS